MQNFFALTHSSGGVWLSRNKPEIAFFVLPLYFEGFAARGCSSRAGAEFDPQATLSTLASPVSLPALVSVLSPDPAPARTRQPGSWQRMKLIF